MPVVRGIDTGADDQELSAAMFAAARPPERLHFAGAAATFVGCGYVKRYPPRAILDT